MRSRSLRFAAQIKIEFGVFRITAARTTGLRSSLGMYGLLKRGSKNTFSCLSVSLSGKTILTAKNVLASMLGQEKKIDL